MADPPAPEPREAQGKPRTCGCEAYCDDCLDAPVADCDLVSFSRSLFARFGEAWHDWGQWEATEFSGLTLDCPHHHSHLDSQTEAPSLRGVLERLEASEFRPRGGSR